MPTYTDIDRSPRHVSWETAERLTWQWILECVGGVNTNIDIIGKCIDRTVFGTTPITTKFFVKMWMATFPQHSNIKHIQSAVNGYWKSI